MKPWITAALLAATATAQAATVWDESTRGDLSNNGLAPTALVTTVGHNLVLGTTGNDGSGIDRDYFSFTIPAGAALTELWLLPATSVSGGASFIGIQAGPQLTVTPSGGGIEAFYGFGHYDNSQIGSDILAALVGPAKAPVPAGTYAVWVQETGGPARYALDFVITSAVPEPAAALSLGLGLLGLVCRRFVLQRR
jgi:hypothetical protein